MKIFGFGSGGAETGVPGDPAEKNVRQSRFYKNLLSVCAVLLILAVCVEIYRRAENYGAKVVARQPVPAYLEIANAPACLDPQIIAQLRNEAVAFACKDDETFARAQNVSDTAILRQIAAIYEGPNQAIGFNAWISKVTEVRRNVAPDKSQQTIRIFAQWRTPAAWVRAGQTLYLVDRQGVRLPGDYPLADRTAGAGGGLMTITGIDQPPPKPGDIWPGATDGDLAAGMKLVDLLKTERFAGQIDAIDMTNYTGRHDARAPWVLLATIWPASNGPGPRVIEWGRPIGQEKYYDVQAAAKVNALNQIFLKYQRIDADRDSVDIHTEQVTRKLATQADQDRPRHTTG